jgi:hypothetical protein
VPHTATTFRLDCHSERPWLPGTFVTCAGNREGDPAR